MYKDKFLMKILVNILIPFYEFKGREQNHEDIKNTYGYSAP